MTMFQIVDSYIDLAPMTPGPCMSGSQFCFSDVGSVFSRSDPIFLLMWQLVIGCDRILTYGTLLDVLW